MVQIIGIEKKTNKKTNQSYVVLLVQGSAEVLISKTSGRPYISAKRSQIPCALDEEQAKSLIGQTLPGDIEVIECNPFEVKLPNGKKIKVAHSFQYSPERVVAE
jgi:hypothetical protein